MWIYLYIQFSFCSDTDSSSSSQQLSSGMPLSAMTARRKDTLPQLTPSLLNYYKEDLIEHVTNWQGDQVEKQVSTALEYQDM